MAPATEQSGGAIWGMPSQSWSTLSAAYPRTPAPRPLKRPVKASAASALAAGVRRATRRVVSVRIKSRHAPTRRDRRGFWDLIW